MVRKTTKQKNEELAKDNQKLHLYGMKFRAFLTPYQIEQANKSIGCARFTSNYYLNERIKLYDKSKKTLKPNEFKESFIKLKNDSDYLWLA